jgi:hypothetical protein
MRSDRALHRSLAWLPMTVKFLAALFGQRGHISTGLGNVEHRNATLTRKNFAVNEAQLLRVSTDAV